jgi:predicted transglutaminase-like cysteine proteinase
MWLDPAHRSGPETSVFGVPKGDQQMYRTSGSVIAAVVAVVVGGIQWSSAGHAGTPALRQAALQHIELGSPTLPPFAYTAFCLRYQGECRSQRSFRGGRVRVTEERWADLQAINRAINLAIVPVPNKLGFAGREWNINPNRGDCGDYAVSKRHVLLRRGWPARTLLLSEVVINSGEHHLVLLVRTRSGDLVLDNFTSQIKSWSQVPYRWVRVQMPSDSRLWTTIGGRGA